MILQRAHLAWEVGIVALGVHNWVRLPKVSSFSLAACTVPSSTVNAARGVGALGLVPA